MSPARTRVLRVLLFCCLLAAVAPLGAQAAARTSSAVPCWKRLLNDWYDGTINKVYPVPCYQQAVSHLPADLRIYGSARDDILAARQAALTKKPIPPEKGHPSTSRSTTTTTTTAATTTAAAVSTSTTTTTTKTVTTNGTTTTTTTVLVVPVQITPPKKSGGLGGALDKLNPGNPDSFPLPLLILGALAILLVIAGAAGMLWQRSHPRDDGAEA
jgi:cobalamin biosynthesis Mg chelatase CobN